MKLLELFYMVLASKCLLQEENMFLFHDVQFSLIFFSSVLPLFTSIKLLDLHFSEPWLYICTLVHKNIEKNCTVAIWSSCLNAQSLIYWSKHCTFFFWIQRLPGSKDLGFICQFWSVFFGTFVCLLFDYYS